MKKKEECCDCGYSVNGKCIHEYSEHCTYGELWTPKWFLLEKKEKESGKCLSK